MKRSALFVIFILSIAHLLSAAVRDIRFSHIGTERGLSHATVNGICQDAYGYLWVATPNGVDRFDGYGFVSFIPDSTDRNVRALVADSRGDIWAATERALCHYLPDSERFESFSLPDAVAANAIVAIDSTAIDVASSHGIYRFDVNSLSFKQLPATSGYNVTAIIACGSSLYAGTDSGSLLEYSQVCRPVAEDLGIINTLFASSDRLFIGTEGNGLLALNLSTGAVAPVDCGIGSHFVRSLAIDVQGRLWVGTFTGLYVLDSECRKVVFFDNASLGEGSLSHASVRRMFADNLGGIWLGTFFGGLNYYHPKHNQFATLRRDFSSSQSLSGNIAGPMAEDSSGNIWIGTNDGGLNIYNPRTGHIRHISTADGLLSNDIKEVYIDSARGIAFIGSHNGGLASVDMSSLRVTTYPGVADNVYDIMPALVDGYLWLATLNGLSLYNIATHTAVEYKVPGMPSLTTCLMRDDSARLWVAGEDGLACFVEQDLRLSRETSLPALSCHVNDIFLSRNTGYYWIATYQGLGCYDPTTDKRILYTTANGLPDNIVYAISEDPNGNIWASTHRGLVCLNAANKGFTTYYMRDGLQSGQFTDRSALVASNGLMYFGGTDGVSFFNPSVFERNTVAPPPQFVGVRLFNKPVHPGDDSGILSVGIAKADKLTFNAEQTTFAIDFTVCDYISNGANTFKYKLDGIDNQWITLPPNVRSVSYSNLPSGKYKFRLLVANNDGVWSSSEAAIDIVILPPWYKTWWAITLFFILAIAAVFAAASHLWRRQLREKQHKAQRELTEMKVRFFVNMSHELRTPLTLMLLPLNELLAAKPDAATAQKLTMAKNNAQRIQHIVDQLLDYRRAELGIFSLRVTPTDVNTLVGELIKPYSSLADKKKITLQFNSTVADSNVYIDTSYMELIVNNLVTNAFKYTPAGGSIDISLALEGSRLSLSVADTGCGIPPDKIDKIFVRFYQLAENAGGYGIGLSLVKRLVELHHGEISVQSEVGHGSRFSVSLPASQADYSPQEIQQHDFVPTKQVEEVDALLPMDDNAPIPDEVSSDDSRKCVLIVDDNADILKYLSSALSVEFRTLTAANGSKAIDQLAANQVDIVVSDVMMPDMDGVQLCRAIKRNLRTSHIPVILLSAKSEVADKLAGFNVGADDYVAKPFSMPLLLAKIRNQVRTRENIIRHYSQQTTAIDPATVAQNPLDEEFLTKAAKLMNDHIDDVQFTTDEFARQMCMSRSNLHLKMKALTGESTNDFIRRVRMHRAAELLKSHRYTVSEVSAMVGYSTPSYFATAFKNFYGNSPSTLLARQ